MNRLLCVRGNRYTFFYVNEYKHGCRCLYTERTHTHLFVISSNSFLHQTLLSQIILLPIDLLIIQIMSILNTFEKFRLNADNFCPFHKQQCTKMKVSKQLNPTRSRSKQRVSQGLTFLKIIKLIKS